MPRRVKAHEAGFEGLWISDHYHPWNDEQGHSPFVWSVIGAIAQAVPGMPMTTAVTCPTIRIHPAVIAQAAATSAVMLDGRFRLGVGSGEALNEHILGDRWPEADERLEMLEEAIEVIRTLWEGGVHDHRGRHYRVEHARVYDLPDSPPEIVVSGFGPKAMDLAARSATGSARWRRTRSRSSGSAPSAGAGTLVQGGMKVCWGEDEAECRRTVHRLWPNEALPGELAQVLPTPEHFEQASRSSPRRCRRERPCGPDIDHTSRRSGRSPTPASTRSTSTRSAPSRTLLRGLPGARAAWTEVAIARRPGLSRRRRADPIRRRLLPGLLIPDVEALPELYVLAGVALARWGCCSCSSCEQGFTEARSRWSAR